MNGMGYFSFFSRFLPIPSTSAIFIIFAALRVHPPHFEAVGLVFFEAVFFRPKISSFRQRLFQKTLE